MDQLDCHSSLIKLSFPPFEALVSPKNGACLESLKRSIDGAHDELIYVKENSDIEPSKVWSHGGCALLFPFAGRVYWQGSLGSYCFDGNGPYFSSIHGFAYQRQWRLQSYDKHSVKLELKSDATTIENYPWNFSIITTWSLGQGGLRCQNQITNLGCVTHTDLAMPVLMGSHPYFSTNGSKKLKLLSSASKVYLVNDKGLRGDEINAAEPLDLNDRRYHSLILEGEAPICAKLEMDTRSIEVHNDSASHMILWTNKPDAYICLEPWMGEPNAVHKGSGLLRIHKGEQRDWGFTIS